MSVGGPKFKWRQERIKVDAVESIQDQRSCVGSVCVGLFVVKNELGGFRSFAAHDRTPTTSPWKLLETFFRSEFTTGSNTFHS